MANEVAAALSTALTGNNNDLVFTAKEKGPAGNLIGVKYVDPGAATQGLSVTTTYVPGAGGYEIVVSLATDGSSVITTIASDIATAIAAATGFNTDDSPKAARLVTVANKAANDGTGLVTALALTFLSGGADNTTTLGYDDATAELADLWTNIDSVNAAGVTTYIAETHVNGITIRIAAATANGRLQATKSFEEFRSAIGLAQTRA